MPTSVKITAILTAHPNKMDALANLLVDMAPRCRAEPGNLRWDVWQDSAVQGRYVLDELYVNEAAAATHRETAHYKSYLAVIGDLADRQAMILHPFEVDGSAN